MIAEAHYDPPVYGHLGINKTVKLVEQNYWWPTLRQDVTTYIQGCADCQWHNVALSPNARLTYADIMWHVTELT